MKKLSLAIAFLFLIQISCLKEMPAVIKVKTLSAIDIMATSARLRGDIIDIGEGIADHGHCWAEHSNPEISDFSSNHGSVSDTKSYNTDITNLKTDSKYYFRTWVKGYDGTIKYGDVLNFITRDGIIKLTTNNLANITQISVTSGGNIIDDGGSYVISRGVCWNTTSSPTIEDNRTNDGSGTGSFSSEITDLDAEKSYSLRAFATNNYGTFYGQEVTFSFSYYAGSFIDMRDGNSYLWKRIGDQIWMAENLAYLPRVSPPSIGNDGYANYYVYGYSGIDVSSAKAKENYNAYGVLYNWPAATSACPDGWHLPSDDEWKELEISLGMSQLNANRVGFRGTDEGSQLAGNSSLWTDGALVNSPAFGANGFTALPGGLRGDYGSFNGIGETGLWWSATEVSENSAWYREIWFLYTDIKRASFNKEDGFSVRCIRDDN